MEPMATIKHRIGLVIRLIDSVSGREISERNVMFEIPDGIGEPIIRGNGVYLFINIIPKDFELEVHVYGYESGRAKIVFQDLDEKMPVQELYLLPLDFPAGGKEVLTLQGNMPGIKAIEAVSLNEVTCSIKSYEKRKHIMVVMNPHNFSLSRIHYGLLNSERTRYTKIQVERELSHTQLQLKGGLEEEWVFNQAIQPIIWGKVSDNGDYMLRVAESKSAIYLVRFEVDDEVFFQKVDFNQLEELVKGDNTWES